MAAESAKLRFDVDELNAQHVEWDLNKTSKTLTETLIGLFLVA